MKLLFFSIIVLVVAVWLGLFIAKDPGYALFSYQQWTLEMPLWFAVLAIFLLVIILYFLVKVVAQVWSSKRRVVHYFDVLRENKQANLTKRLLNAQTQISNAEYEHAWKSLHGLEKSDFHQTVVEHTWVTLCIAFLKTKQTALELTSLWNKVPRKFQNQADVLAAYAQQLLTLGEANVAEIVLKKALAKHPDDRLFYYYGKITTDKQEKRLKWLETYLKKAPNNPYLLFAAGSLARDCQLWGKAKEYLKKSLNQKILADAYFTLGDVLEKLGDKQGAFTCYREGSQLPQKPGGIAAQD